MNIKRVIYGTIAIAFLSLSIVSCKKDKVETDTPEQSAKVVTDSIYTSFSPEHFSFYSFSEKGLVPVSDSATDKWDFGVSFVYLIFNGGASGPGQGGVIVQQGDFDTFEEGPTTGYLQDTEEGRVVNSTPFDPGAWYVYNIGDHSVSPKAGQFFLVKTGNGKYAKLDIYNSDYDDWNGDEGTPPDVIFYRFRFVYQPDGTANFNTED